MYEEFDELETDSIIDDDDDDDYLLDELDYESDKDNSSQMTFSPFCERVTRKKELPTPLFAGKILFCFFLNL